MQKLFLVVMLVVALFASAMAQDFEVSKRETMRGKIGREEYDCVIDGARADVRVSCVLVHSFPSSIRFQLNFLSSIGFIFCFINPRCCIYLHRHVIGYYHIE
jgi:hypothetical protein